MASDTAQGQALAPTERLLIRVSTWKAMFGDEASEIKGINHRHAIE